MTSSKSRRYSTASTSRVQYKEGIRLAEMGEWDTLMEKLRTKPQLSRCKDHHGMLILHWACTKEDVPSNVLEALLAIYPESISAKNNAQYLPIHIAVKAKASKESLRILFKACPSNIVEETPSGKTPLMLAVDVDLPADSMQVLTDAEIEYKNSVLKGGVSSFQNTKKKIERYSQMLRESMMKRAFDFQPDLLPPNPQKLPQEPVVKHLDRASQMLRVSMMSRPFGAQPEIGVSSNLVNVLEDPVQEEDEEGLEQSAASPRMSSTRRGSDPIPLYSGDNDESSTSSTACGVCDRKFSMFRIKYQCKGCHIYLCKKHVAGKVQLPQFQKKHNVCGNCFQAHHESAINVSSRHHSNSTPVIMHRPRTSSGPYLNPGSHSRSANISLSSEHSRDSHKSTSIHHLGSETASKSVIDQAPQSAEVAALLYRVTSLEDKNKSLTDRLAEQEKQYGEVILFLNQMMSRVAELELRISKPKAKASQK
jgi:hypothetical protein